MKYLYVDGKKKIDQTQWNEDVHVLIEIVYVMKYLIISLGFLSRVFQKQCIYLHDCRVKAVV